MRENLVRYLPWQMRDFVRERGIALILIGLAVGFTTIAPFRAMRMTFDDVTAQRMLLLSLPQVAFVAAFVAFNGIVSTDRKMGYYRFLFSKPVSIPAFYAQRFVVYFVGFLAVFAVLLAAFSFFVRPVAPLGAMAYCALVYLSLGGVAFFISSLFRYDWPILAGVFLGSTILHSIWSTREGWRRMVLSLLPPLHKLSPALGDLVTRGTADMTAIAWLLGYSAFFFAAGLIVLRRRPFA
ncbi:MAG TPA: hypothetical protein VM939_09715 [Gemmatimonadaceae bacterium]|nr:hypothetical protein [Gemmatimonadaceae bacterium]